MLCEEELHQIILYFLQMSWITEKDLLVSQKIHIDNDFMQTLLKRIDELEAELSTHKRQVPTSERRDWFCYHKSVFFFITLFR